MRITAIAGLLFLPFAAFAQLTPGQLYYGVDRPAVIDVARPAGAEGALSISLSRTDVEASATKVSVEAGKADLAALIDNFWHSEGSNAVRYAQLYAGETPVGPALVLQPLLNPPYASLSGRAAVFPPSQPGVLSGVRVYVDKYVEMETTAGTMVFRMRPDQAPNTAYNFMHLAEGGIYTGVIFHRIINNGPRGPFVIQGGDPTGTGMGGPGYMIDLEPSKLPHDFGVLSMARSGDPNTNGSQFFVCLSRDGTSFLDTQYTTFGECIKGADVITKIAGTPTNAEDRPMEPPVIKSVKLVDADPLGTGPERVKRP